MKQQTKAELIRAMERAETRNIWDAWLVRALRPAPGWRVVVSPRGYQIILAHISPEGYVTMWDTVEAVWPEVKAELLFQAGREGAHAYEALTAALADVSKAKSAHGFGE